MLTDLQQKVTNLQTSVNNQRPTGTGQPSAHSNLDVTLLNEVKETVRLIKSETNSLLQKAVRERLETCCFERDRFVVQAHPVQCPSVAGAKESSCLGPYTFIAVIAAQVLALIAYLAFRNRQDRVSRKYL